MIITGSVLLVSAGISALVTRSVRNSRKRRHERRKRIASLGRRLEAALVGFGLDAVWYYDSRKIEPPRAKQVGQIQLAVNAVGTCCGGCGILNVIELRYVVAAVVCGAKRLYIGDACDACGYFVAAKRQESVAALQQRPEDWIKVFTETVNLEDLLEHLERRAIPPDATELERRERELEAELGEVRLQLQGVRESRGELADGPFRPRLPVGGQES